MDTLSRLIDVARLHASLDLRCLLTGGFDIDNAPLEAGIAPFHLVLGGACVVEPAGGARLTLNAGDFLLFPRGAAHRVRDVGRGAVTAPVTSGHDGMLPVRRNDRRAEARAEDGNDSRADERPDLDLLCGRFVYAPGSSALLLDALPDPFHVSLGGAQSLGALQTLIAFMRAEAEQRRPG